MLFKNIKISWASLGMAALLLTACAQNTMPSPANTQSQPGGKSAQAAYPTPMLTTSIPVAKIVSPLAGKATVHGLVISAETGKPLNNTPVRLAEVYRQGNSDPVYVLNTASSPGGMTNNDGDYVIANIDAREYVMFIGDPAYSYAIIKDSSGKEKIWKMNENQVMNMGAFTVTLK